MCNLNLVTNLLSQMAHHVQYNMVVCKPSRMHIAIVQMIVVILLVFILVIVPTHQALQYR